MAAETDSIKDRMPVVKRDRDSDSKDDVGIGISDEIQEDQELEKRVLRKLDTNLMTLFSFLYLFSYLGECGLSATSTDINSI